MANSTLPRLLSLYVFTSSPAFRRRLVGGIPASACGDIFLRNGGLLTRPLHCCQSTGDDALIESLRPSRWDDFELTAFEQQYRLVYGRAGLRPLLRINGMPIGYLFGGFGGGGGCLTCAVAGTGLWLLRHASPSKLEIYTTDGRASDADNVVFAAEEGRYDERFAALRNKAYLDPTCAALYALSSDDDD